MPWVCLQFVTGLDPEGLFTGGGGGGTSSRRLKPSGASRERGESLRGVEPDFFLKIYVSENAFKVILKPFFSLFFILNFK